MNSPMSHPMATSHKKPEEQLLDAFGRTIPNTNDPAWQPPKDPLKGDVKRQSNLVHREIPITTVQTGWAIPQVRQAIESLVIGLFDQPAQLVDSISGDSRVHSAYQQRIGGLLGRPIQHRIPAKYKDSQLAKECHDAWVEHWPIMASEPVLSDMSLWGTMLGFWTGQQVWDTSGDYWLPYLMSWHPRYTYFHWTYMKYIAITLDGQVPITAGDGHWLMYAPYGQYRGWMRGAIRAIAPWWLSRNYALRDWARYSERHGMPIGKAITPMGADPIQVQNFRNDLSNLGQESMLQLPQSASEDFGKYDLEWLETTDQAWDGFQGLITQCNAEITLAVLGQNLTSEIKEGSLAAARVHADVRQAILEADARALAHMIYLQVARPFAAINFGNPDLAPKTCWDIIPFEDNKTNADTFYQFATSLKMMRDAGFSVKDISIVARQFGLVLTKNMIKEILSESTPIRQYHIDAGAVTRDEVRESIGLAPVGGEDGDKFLGAANENSVQD